MGGSPVTRPSLLMRIRDHRDERAWSQFVEIYAPLIDGYGRKHGLQAADAADLGKTPGKDERAGKATYPSLFGVQASLEQARRLVDGATHALKAVGLGSPVLTELAEFAVDRKS